MAILIPADSTQPAREITPDNGTDFQLAQLYQLLSCDLIEVLPIADGHLMILDEEGKLANKPRNERATHLADFVSPRGLVAELLRARETGAEIIWAGPPLTDLTTEVDYIAGDVLICTENEFR